MAYLYRLFFLFWDIYFSNIFSLPNSGSDADGFHYVGVLKSLGYSSYSYGGAYTSLLGYIYNIFGPERIISQYLNLLLSMLTIIIFRKILVALNLENKKIALGLILIGFLPNLAIISIVLRRESLIILLITISLYYFVKWYIHSKNRYIFIAGIFSLIASIFHSGAVAPLIGYALAYILYDSQTHKIQFNRKTIFSLTLTAFLFFSVYIYIGDVVFSKFERVDSLDDLSSDIGESRGGSGYSVSIQSGNPTVDLILNTPIRSIYFILAPMPWDWRNFNDVFAFVFSSLFYGYCLYKGYVYSKKNLKNKTISSRLIMQIFIFSICLIGILTFAWGVSNAGTALRHRDKFVTLFILLLLLSNTKKSFRNELENEEYNKKIQ